MRKEDKKLGLDEIMLACDILGDLVPETAGLMKPCGIHYPVGMILKCPKSRYDECPYQNTEKPLKNKLHT